MVIFLNLDGSAEKITPQRIYQGSNNVTEITVIAPYPPDTALEIGFILPDGLYWNTPDGAHYAPMGFVGQNAETRASAWNYVLPRSVTERQGEVCAAINARADDGNTTSYLCRFVIEESVLPEPPSAPEPGVYDLLLSYLARLDGRTANVPNLVAKIQKVAGNAFTYTNNSGVVSAPIVINGGADAPIPVNTASTIELPESAWQPVYSGQTVTGYTAEIQAEMHGQMRDGATARDLWLGFDTVSNAEITGDYPEYKVNAAGDITLSANSPVAMTVRVWNGKSIVDYTARDMITAETERAETAERELQANIDAETERAEAVEKDLQSQIDHIEQSGVDLTARAAIAAETERAEAAERILQENIDAETERAEAAESELKADIDTKADRLAAAEYPQAYVEKENGGVIGVRVSQGSEAFAIPQYDGNGNVKTREAVSPDDCVNKQALDAEKNRAEGVEQTLASDINGLREDINNEEHFRGMFESVEALKAAYPTATPNDYAYIIGGNVWIWHDDGGWQNSNKPTPNTAVPASDATPLMDGVASAGTLGAYSRGDHRHASDTSKVNKSGDTMTGPLNCPFNNNFIVHGKEFNFIPQGYNNDVFVNYRGGVVGDYHFTNGDSNGGLANIRAADVYDHGQRVFSPHNLPTALKDYADGQAAYLEYGSRALDLNEFTYLACWSGHVVRAVDKRDALPSGGGTDSGEALVKYLSIPVVTSLGSVVICYGRVSTSGSSAVFQDISFPVTYTYTPNVLTTYNGNNTGIIENLYGWVKQNSITTRGFTVRSYGGNSITYLAIGKIK